MKYHHRIAIDSDGKPLSFTPAQVQDVVDRTLAKGELVLVMSRTEGRLACQVLGPPSEEIASALEACAKAYRKSLGMPEHGGE